MSTEEKSKCCAGLWKWTLTNHTREACLRWAMLILRVGVGVMFAMAGWGKVMDFSRAVGAAEGAGFPAPEFFGGCLVAAELGGGILLVLGALVRPVALVEIFVMAMAMRTNWGDGFPDNFPRVYGNAMVILICLALLVAGGGALSLMSGGGRAQQAPPPPPKE